MVLLLIIMKNNIVSKGIIVMVLINLDFVDIFLFLVVLLYFKIFFGLIEYWLVFLFKFLSVLKSWFFVLEFVGIFLLCSKVFWLFFLFLLLILLFDLLFVIFLIVLLSVFNLCLCMLIIFFIFIFVVNVFVFVCGLFMMLFVGFMVIRMLILFIVGDFKNFFIFLYEKIVKLRFIFVCSNKNNIMYNENFEKVLIGLYFIVYGFNKIVIGINNVN